MKTMPTLDLERRLQQSNTTLVAGVDEAGRGPLAGPVVAAAVILPPSLEPSLKWLQLVNDSKKLSPLQRETALQEIEAHALAIDIGMASPQEIDSMGIAKANRSAMVRAIEGLPIKPHHLLIDFVALDECGLPYDAMVGGDALCYSIAAASVVAKVTRDRLMMEADVSYPGYEFARHKGYGTREHLRLLQLIGPSPIHRMSFAPVARLLAPPEETETLERELRQDYSDTTGEDKAYILSVTRHGHIPGAF